MDFSQLPSDIQYLVNSQQPFDSKKLSTLDGLTSNLMSGRSSPQEMHLINKIWESFKEDQGFWLNTDFILTNSQQEYTKFYALITLEDAIQKRWNTFPDQQKEGLKKYMIDLVIKQGSFGNLTKEQLNSLSKCNSILIAILKYEWNTTWQTFIPDICAASKANEHLCKNNLKLLRMLSEEIFDYSKNSLTSQKKQEMKKNFENQFQEVFQLCSFIAKTFMSTPEVVRPDLISSNLETLHSFLSWIPLGYIFFTDILDILCGIMQYPSLRGLAIKCLYEVVLIPIDESDSDKQKVQQKLFSMYQNSLQKIQSFIPCDVSLHIEREKMKSNPNQINQFDDLCTQLSLYLTGFFNTHLSWIQQMINTCNNESKMSLMEEIRKGLVYIVMFNELQEDNIFKICSEFWMVFTDKLVQDPESQNNQHQSSILNMGYSGQNATLQQNIYPAVLTQVRKIIISRMARPNEVLIKVEDDEVVKEEVKDTENQALYQTLRQLLINLSKLDWEVMKQIMSNKLDKQLDGSEWSWDNINSISWAIGSISGTLPDQEEKQFLISAIRTLLNLCEMRKGKNNKAVVASNIMYVVGQYPKFLKANWNFLKTVVKKLFEFMKETFPGVMEMAVNTFLTIAQKCKDEFVKKQGARDDMRGNGTETEPYIYELIRKIPEETSMLSNQDKYTFYEAIGHMISAEPNQETQTILINSTCSHMFEELQMIINTAQSQGQEKMTEKEVVDRLLYILKVQEKLAFSTGYCYAAVLLKIFDTLMKIYQFYSGQISIKLQNEGIKVLNFFVVKQMRNVKRQILKLMQTFFQHCNSSNTIVNQDMIISTLVIPFQHTCLADYMQINNELKDPELLIIYTILFENMSVKIGQSGLVPQILKGIFDPTLPMIQLDFNSFPEVREKFFYFLKAVVNNSMEALFNIPPDQFKTMIDCVIWAAKHHLPNLFMVGLEVLLFIFKNVNTNPQIANSFYSIYYMSVLKDLLEIITDGYHKSGFSVQYQILALLLQIVDGSFLSCQIDPQNQGSMNNQQYIYEFLVNALSNAFKTISKQQTQQHIQNMFQSCGNPNAFKVHLRDYLINLQQYSDDSDHMYDDKEREQQKQQQNNQTAQQQ